jgi:hypothetical protein
MNRCGWAKDDLAIRYHDEEWGVPVQEDRRWFEFLAAPRCVRLPVPVWPDEPVWSLATT